MGIDIGCDLCNGSKKVTRLSARNWFAKRLESIHGGIVSVSTILPTDKGALEDTDCPECIQSERERISRINDEIRTYKDQIVGHVSMLMSVRVMDPSDWDFLFDRLQKINGLEQQKTSSHGKETKCQEKG